MYQKIKGTIDFVGQEALKKDYVEKVARNICLNNNLEEIITPIFENTSVFVRSSGDGSDIVSKEMYSFLDKGENNITLRPEGTACVVRSFIENKLYVNSGVKKYFYTGPMFRYERPQKGRTRQFNQFGVEFFGEDNYFQDASLIILADAIFKKMNLGNHYLVHINTIGDEVSRKNYKKSLYDYFSNYKNCLCNDCLRRLEKNTLRILDCKVCKDKEFFNNSPKIKDYLTEESVTYFDNIIKVLDYFKIDYQINENLVRGLDYYTDVVFEFIIKGNDDEASLNNIALCAGGKYKELVKSFGGPEVSGIGFAFGIERCMALLDYHNLFNFDNQVTIVLISLDVESKLLTLKLGNELASNNISFDIDYKSTNFKPQFKLVDRVKPKYIGIIGEDERKRNVITIKEDGVSKEIEINNLIKFLKGEEYV